MMEPSSRTISFTKMTGSGNDFIIIDNRSHILDADQSAPFIRAACRRKFSVGADGLIFIQEDPETDFQWRFFNADSSEAEMCGNGARCAARFAFLKGIVSQPNMTFRTRAGIIAAEVQGRRVKIRMTPPEKLLLDFPLESSGQVFSLNFINTGVPHVVGLLDSKEALDSLDVHKHGNFFRFHEKFQPAGTNVNFAHVQDRNHMLIRTYERGVEDETLACGTGAMASALVAAAKGLVNAPVQLATRSGETLTIHFSQSDSGGPGAEQFSQVYLEGDARVVYEADLWDETL